MTILFDLDSTVLDTARVLRRIWQRRQFGPPNEARWDWGSPAEMRAALADLGAQYRHITAYPHAETVMAQLYAEQHQLHFVTARPPDHLALTASCLTAANILRYGTLHCLGETPKLQAVEALGGDVLVDDRALTCVQLHELGHGVIVYDQPWNRFLDLPRAVGWANDTGVGAMLGAPTYTGRRAAR